MSRAFSTKRPRTSGSETHVSGKNGAVNKNGVAGKYGVLCKNDALEGNDARPNAATARQPKQRRAEPNGPSALHTRETCVHYLRCLPRNTNKTTDRDAGCFDAPCRPRGARADRGPRLGTAESAAAARGSSRVSGVDSKDRPRSLVGTQIRRLGPAHRGGAQLRSLPHRNRSACDPGHWRSGPSPSRPADGGGAGHQPADS